ncbi:MAG TPA: hypothetical protein VK137_05080, partial [Planctomycetaceae bacterium]|nr:hypothetical protein [Planctomycetaceae bacterium]
MRPFIQQALTVTAIAAFLVGCRSTGASGPVNANARRVPAQSVVEHSAASSTSAPQPTNMPAVSSTIQLVSGESTAETALALMPADSPKPLALTLTQAIETGLAQNPDLVTQRHTERVSEAALGVAEIYPFNPWVQVQATPYQRPKGGGGSGTTDHYVLLMQQIQLAHQQRYREEGASAALNSTRWNIVQAESL